MIIMTYINSFLSFTFLILAMSFNVFFCSSSWAQRETRPIVFMISGVAGSDFSSLAPYFEENGLDYRFIPGQWGGSISTRVQFSSEQINKILENSKRPCAVIGHSYGGVVAREIIQTKLGSRCKLFISSASPQGSSPWANYVKGLALQAPGKLPENILAMALDLIFNIKGPTPSSITLNSVGAIFFLIRGFPKWDESLKNWENNFLAALDDLETHKLTPDEQINLEMPVDMEAVSFGLSQRRTLPDLSWPHSILHRGIHRISIFLEKITPSSDKETQTTNILNDGIIPTRSMKFGPSFYCTEGSHFSGMHSLMYLGTVDLRGQLLKAYSSLAACKLLGTKQTCLNWQLIQSTFNSCPSIANP